MSDFIRKIRQYLFVHFNPDMDAVLSAVFVKIFSSDIRWTHRFVPANFDGDGMEDGDIAVDVTVPKDKVLESCIVIKGESRDGLVMSAFASVMKRFAPSHIFKGMASLINMVDYQDSKGQAIRRLMWPKADNDQVQMFYFTSLPSIINCLGRKLTRTAQNGKEYRDDNRVINAIQEIMEGYLLLLSRNLLDADRDVLRLEKMLRLWALKKFVPAAKDADIMNIPDEWGCFPQVVQMQLSTEDMQALSDFSDYISQRQQHGDIWRRICPELNQEEVDMLRVVSLETILDALLIKIGKQSREDLEEVFKCMSLIFDGHYEIRSNQMERVRRYENNPDNYYIIPDYEVPVAINICGDKFLNTYLFSQKGIKIVVYKDGNCIGITCDNGPWGVQSFRMDDPKIMAVWQALDEDPFSHEAGFLTCIGSKKSPPLIPSNVRSEDLAKVAGDLCREHSITFG